MVRCHTLRSIALEMGREKRSVQNWYAEAKQLHGELGELIDGTRRFNDAEREILIGFAGDRSPKVQAIAPDVLPKDFIQPGKLATVDSHQIQLPEGFNPAEMVRFFDGVVGKSTDTQALVKIADLALSAVESAMDEKLQEQEQQLKAVKQDAKALQERLSATKTKLQIQALKSELLAREQTDTTQSVEDLFAALMAMGKPQDAGQR